MTQPASWSARLTRQVAGEIKRWRDKRGLSAQQLADACHALGHPVPRSVIANLESGRRETITAAELVVLARALDVPPVELLYPLGQVPAVEVVPGRSVATDEALLWFTGRRDLFRDETATRSGHGQQDPATGLHEWYETGYDEAAYPVHTYSEHAELIAEWQEAVSSAHRRMPKAADEDSPAFRQEVATLRGNAERALRIIRDDMRRRGVPVLPALPPELEHVDERGKAGRR